MNLLLVRNWKKRINEADHMMFYLRDSVNSYGPLGIKIFEKYLHSNRLPIYEAEELKKKVDNKLRDFDPNSVCSLKESGKGKMYLNCKR